MRRLKRQSLELTELSLESIIICKWHNLYLCVCRSTAGGGIRMFQHDIRDRLSVRQWCCHIRNGTLWSKWHAGRGTVWNTVHSQLWRRRPFPVEPRVRRTPEMLDCCQHGILRGPLWLWRVPQSDLSLCPRYHHTFICQQSLSIDQRSEAQHLLSLKSFRPSVRLSVCPSVRRTRASCTRDSSYQNTPQIWW